MWLLLEIVISVVAAGVLLAAIVAGMAFAVAPTKFLSNRKGRTAKCPRS